MAESSSPNDRLDSWKEIAKYLNRAEKTVSRWEKRGLPVHRVPGGQAVFAYKHELDTWLKDGKGLLDSSSTETPAEPADVITETPAPLLLRPEPIAALTSIRPSPEEESPNEGSPVVLAVEPLISVSASTTTVSPCDQPSFREPARSTHWKPITIITSVLSLALVVGVVLFVVHRPIVVRIAHLQKLTNDGHGKANLRSDGTTLYFNEFEANREILLATPMDGGVIHAINTPFPNVDLQDTSNDGQNLLVTSFEGMEKGGRPLWIIPARGGTPRRVGDVLCDRARWSPDNRKIACANGGSILVFESDGSAVRTVGSFSSIPYKLLWSPQGDKLRFVLMGLTAGTLTPWELTIKNDESTNLAAVRLPLGENCCWDWMWTRDDKNLLYTKRDTNGRPALFIKPHNSWLRPETDLPLETPSIGDLVPGRTNAQLYLQMGDTYRGQLLKFDSKQNKFQIAFEGLSATCLSFSKDHQWMTYRRTEDLTVWRSRVDGSEAIQLTKPGIETEYSAWSPDGKQIALMMKYPEKPWRIFLMDRDGGAMKEAAHGSDNQGAPTWSPDGKMLVYGNTSCEKTQPCWIRRIDLATGTEELLPGSYGFRTARWSPDGKYILALQNETHELMLFDVRTQRWTVLADSITGDNPNWANDSQYIYADTLQEKTPVIERVRVNDGHRDTVANLTPLQRIPGQLDSWVGLAPDDSLLLLHQFSASEVYALEWTIQ